MTTRSFSFNGIEVAVDGPDSGYPVILCMGAGEQLTHWPEELVLGLVAHGFRVVRFDARDTGLSPRYEQLREDDFPTVFARLVAGDEVLLPYTLIDMANDIVGIMDGLNLAAAHLVGVSLGGMQAQIVAARHPERVASLTSIMSNSGNPALPPPDPEITAKLLSASAPDADDEARIEHFIAIRSGLAGSEYLRDATEWRAAAERSLARGAAPASTPRQIAASLATRDRYSMLADIMAPTLVIHGADDPVMPVASGEDTANTITGARCIVIPGMGHDVSAALAPALVALIAEHAAAASESFDPDQVRKQSNVYADQN